MQGLVLQLHPKKLMLYLNLEPDDNKNNVIKCRTSHYYSLFFYVAALYGPKMPALIRVNHVKMGSPIEPGNLVF